MVKCDVRLVNVAEENKKMKIYIKNMVCNRCIYAVKNELIAMGQEFNSIELGEVDFGEHQLAEFEKDNFRLRLENLGFEILNDKTSQLIEKIKTTLINFIEQELSLVDKPNISDYLSKELNIKYSMLSNLFSTVSGLTIEQYFIQLKIEKVKEYLIYDELTLSEISYQLGYSSVAHASSQFKRLTGMTPSQFKKLKGMIKRKTLDSL